MDEPGTAEIFRGTSNQGLPKSGMTHQLARANNDCDIDEKFRFLGLFEVSVELLSEIFVKTVIFRNVFFCDFGLNLIDENSNLRYLMARSENFGCNFHATTTSVCTRLLLLTYLLR